MKNLKIHFMGIGGIGMSAIANLCLQKGAKVTGCDLSFNKQTTKLQQANVTIELGHNLKHIQMYQPDILVHSSAVPPHNEELQYAKDNNIEVLSRASMLARLLIDKSTIAVSGSHGKTTTTGIISEILLGLNYDPSVMIGGVSPMLGSNFRYGQGDFFVSEVDESDGSLLHIHPQATLCTNIDMEHLDFYRDWAHIEEVFLNFFKQTDVSGVLVGWGEDIRIRRLFASADIKSFYYGFEKFNDLQIVNAQYFKEGSRCDLILNNKIFKDVNVSLAGKHNLLNAVGAIGLLYNLGIELEKTIIFLAKLSGVKRRFEAKGIYNGAKIIEDYAHHPKEICATLDVASLYSPKRIVVVFQPHRYTRVQGLYQEFITCFKQANTVVLMDIYSANEEPIAGISSQALAKDIKKTFNGEVYHIPNSNAVVDFVKSYIRPNDMVLFLGAGDIGRLSDMIADVNQQLY